MWKKPFALPYYNEPITLGARRSLLSRKQVEEVISCLHKVYPGLPLKAIYLETIGDRDKKTSLRTLEKSDFFTREIDQLQLQGGCRIAVHSAKDLPEPLPKGLKLAALTPSIARGDSIVVRPHETLKPTCLLATSSERRARNSKLLFPDCRLTEIRGTIPQRLDQLFQGDVDGVIIADAALIRLGLTHLKRLHLSGETTPLQGSLALVIREEDDEMAALLSAIPASGD